MASEKQPILPFTTTESLTLRQRRRQRLPLLAFVLSVIAFWSVVYHEAFSTTGLAAWKMVTVKIDAPVGLPDKIQRRWGQYSPYYPAGRYVPPPKGCKISQVHILQRHGARYPNSDDEYDKSIDTLMSAKKFSDPKLKFLKNYEYNLGEELLTPIGAGQSFESGMEAFRKYGHLVSPDSPPYVRASGKARVIDSAGNWTIGFSGASSHHIHPFINQILSESVNNTLNNDCPNASQGSAETQAWLHTFAPPIVHRLQKSVHGIDSADITEEDVYNLMAMCPFESIGLERPSPFCKLFTEEEWGMFEYLGDVEKYYKTGYGNPLGPVQSIGYINELLSRLTSSPIHDNTTHNYSLPFPLNKAIYADFTHENSMVGVFSAMGLFNDSKALDPEKMPEDKEGKREWVASRMVPFSGRMVVEKLECAFGEGLIPTTKMKKKGGDLKEYVRIFVNDALQPLEFCGTSKSGKGGMESMCTLEAFVESQGYARRNGDGDFEKCYS